MRTGTVLFAVIAMLPKAAWADGFMIAPREPERRVFTVKYHHVTVDVDGQAAVTKIDQIFHNDTPREQEGTYIFPMPEGAVITRFSMFVDEKEIKGRILEKSEARRIYEEIVRRGKDPALLEYIGRNTFRARVFPIPPNGDKRIRLQYVEIARKTGRSIRYVYPTSTERFSSRPIEDVRFTAHLRSKSPIRNIYSPTHDIDIQQDSDNEASVRWNARNVLPDKDIILNWTLADSDVGLDILTYREKGDRGFFMLLASPSTRVDPSKIIPKDVVFVLDRTGSMAGEKINQAKGAIRFCLNRLNSGDRFNLITYNESPDLLEKGLIPATRENIRRAVRKVDLLEAEGGTNINQALLTALDQFTRKSSQNYIVFVTDGLPTVGERNIETIKANVRKRNSLGVKIFTFGVGYDVNTILLDSLARDSRADSDYVRPNEDIEAKISDFFAKVSTPVLSDLTLEYDGVKLSQFYPMEPLPDLFKGSQLIIVGRYEGSGRSSIRLTGNSGGRKRTLTLAADFGRADEENDFLPRLWASRRIGYLLDEIRLHEDKELIDEVIHLSKTYGIPTAYTSFLVDERQRELPMEMARKMFEANLKALNRSDSGAGAVAQSQVSGSLRRQRQVGAAPMGQAPSISAGGFDIAGRPGASSNVTNYGNWYYDAEGKAVNVTAIQNVGGRTLYRRGDYWEDQAVRNQKVIVVKQYSNAHFRLLAAYPILSKISALGNVRIVVNNQVLQIGPEGREDLTDMEIREIVGDRS